MLLDYFPATQKFVAKVSRGENSLITSLMNDHGFDFSTSASTTDTAVLSTDTEYAAVTFWDEATPRARQELRGLYETIQASWKDTSNARIRVPADLELFPFQKAGVEYALGRRHTLVADTPGLGKTVQAIAFANEIRANTVLVICPASIRLQWVKMIRRWTTMSRPYVVYPILKSSNGVHPNAAWTIISYDLASNPAIGRALASQHFDLLVLDEMHMVKTSHARRSRAILGGGINRTFDPISSRAERILGLSGTPLPNRPREAFTIAKSLCYDAIDWLGEDQFSERFNPTLRGVTATGKVFVDERTGRHAELQNRLRANFMVRREKRTVMKQLHLPKFDLVHLEETGPIKAALKAEKMLDIDPENLAGADIKTVGQISIVRKQMGVAMAPGVASYVEMLMEGGEDKLFLCGWHLDVLDILQQRLLKFGVRRIDGSTSVTRRQAYIEQFQQDPEVRIILGNIQAIGTGVDGLQDVCSHGVLAEASWVPGENQQVFDRIDRGGQKGHVQFDICVVRNSFSEKIMASALRKLVAVHGALDKKYAR